MDTAMMLGLGPWGKQCDFGMSEFLHLPATWQGSFEDALQSIVAVVVPRESPSVPDVNGGKRQFVPYELGCNMPFATPNRSEGQIGTGLIAQE